MKKLLLSIVLPLCFIGCAPKIYVASYTFDLSEYNKNGMFITESNSVSFEYDPVGLVQTVGGGRSLVNKEYVTLTTRDVLDGFVNECKKQGADAVINIRIATSSKDNIPTYQISGMAVKRK